MRIYSKGKAVLRDNQFYVKLDNKPENVYSDEIKIVNTSVILSDGIPIEGYLIRTHPGKSVQYRYHVQQSDAMPPEIEGYADMLASVTVNRINKEIYLFLKGFKKITVDDVFSERRSRIVVLARNICMALMQKYFSNQVSELHLSILFKKDRTAVYNAVDYVRDHCDTDLQIKSIVEDVESEIKTIYNNLKEE